MVMNGFDTNFDNENEVYAVNTVAFHYARHPDSGQGRRADPRLLGQRDRVRPDQFVPPAREHVPPLPDGNGPRAVRVYRQCHHGSGRAPCVWSLRLEYPGQYMFHAHQSELAELGWMGFFEATE